MFTNCIPVLTACIFLSRFGLLGDLGFLPGDLGPEGEGGGSRSREGGGALVPGRLRRSGSGGSAWNSRRLKEDNRGKSRRSRMYEEQGLTASSLGQLVERELLGLLGLTVLWVGGAKYRE